MLGRDQVALLALYVLAARVAWLWLEDGSPAGAIGRSLLPLGLGGLLAGALIVVPVLMTLVLAGQSNRPVIDLEGAGRGSLHPALLVTLAVPQLFGAADGGRARSTGARRASPGTAPVSTSRRTWGSCTSALCRCC